MWNVAYGVSSMYVRIYVAICVNIVQLINYTTWLIVNTKMLFKIYFYKNE